MRAAFVGLDVGTQSVKGRAIDEQGRLLTEASTEYPLYVPQPGWTEQKPEEMREAAWTTIRRVVGQLGELDPPAEVVGLCFTGQMHTMILLDAAHRPQGVALLWNDGRAAADAQQAVQRLQDSLGGNYLQETLCNDFLANWTGAHLCYVRNRWQEYRSGVCTAEAERWAAAWEAAHSFVTPRDFVVLSLTGEVAMDVCGGSETALMAIGRKAWATEALEVLGLDRLTPPPLLEPGAEIGRVTAAAAQGTGLKQGTPVYAGAGDCLAGALAGGVLEVGQMLFTLGTSGVAVAPIGERPLADPQLRTQVHYSAAPNMLVNMGCVTAAGLGLRFFRDVVGDAYRLAGQKAGVDPYEFLTQRAAQAPPGSNGVLFSPYLTGDRLVKAPQGLGAWYGLSAYLLEEESGQEANLVRAILEGVCFGVRDAVEIIRGLLPAEHPLTEIRMVGGGARSRFWVQLAADIFGCPVCTTTAEDASYGMALLAAVGAGVWSLQEAAAAIHLVDTFFPREPLVCFYDRLYREVYAGHYDRSQRRLDEAMRTVLASAEYREAVACWRSPRPDSPRRSAG